STPCGSSAAAPGASSSTPTGTRRGCATGSGTRATPGGMRTTWSRRRAGHEPATRRRRPGPATAAVAVVALGLLAAGGRAGVTATGSAGTAPRIAAHRGGAGLWPENSLTAFRGALGLGVDLVELDVHQSGDGEVVVIHDPTLDRTTAGRGPVSRRTVGELAAAPLRGGAGEGVPRLRDVLDLLRPTTTGLLLEIKVDAAGARYPVNEPAELERALAAGVDYVTTDRPDLALAIRGRR